LRWASLRSAPFGLLVAAIAGGALALARLRLTRTKKNTEPVAPSSTFPTSFPPGPKASAYDP
jgi:hypothetical protein